MKITTIALVLLVASGAWARQDILQSPMKFPTLLMQTQGRIKPVEMTVQVDTLGLVREITPLNREVDHFLFDRVSDNIRKGNFGAGPARLIKVTYTFSFGPNPGTYLKYHRGAGIDVLEVAVIGKKP